MKKFNEAISKLGYEICERKENNILLEKKYEIANIFILFDLEKKEICGGLKTNKIISNLDQISKQYSIFREMRNDLKYFQQLSKYVIID